MSTHWFRLSHIEFASGPTIGAERATLSPGHITVLVGPNGSGKSLALREIEAWAKGTAAGWVEVAPAGKVVHRCDANFPADPESIRAFLEPRIVDEAASPAPVVSFLSVDQPGQGGGAQSIDLAAATSNQFGHLVARQAVMARYTARLDGRNRLDLVRPQPITSLRTAPGNVLSALGRDDETRLRLRGMVHAALGRYLVLDVTNVPMLELALSETPPPEAAEMVLSHEAVTLQRELAPLIEQSDGVQAFIAIAVAIMVFPHTLMLIDEPEAFLHPALARQLARNISAMARARDSRIVTAAHSADFLLGCIETAANTSVVRLSYQSGYATARVLPSEEVRRLAAEPLLRSVDALRALFARTAVVCEGDSDRVFYEEINRRLYEDASPLGISDCVFLNAQNWQTVVRVAAPLRSLGVPTAVILDLDTLTQGEQWSELLRTTGLTSAAVDALLRRRHESGELLIAAGRVSDDPHAPLKCKVRGLQALADGEESRVRTFLDELAKLGIFIVPVGTLENWLRNLGVTGKENWIVGMLSRLGSRGDGAYVGPGDGDVWDFIKRIRRRADGPVLSVDVAL